MPYIDKTEREILDPLLSPLIERLSYFGDAGMTNYVITRIIDSVWGKDGYADFNTALGVLEAVKQELYRRRIAPYENGKRKEQGDVF